MSDNMQTLRKRIAAAKSEPNPPQDLMETILPKPSKKPVTTLMSATEEEKDELFSKVLSRTKESFLSKYNQKITKGNGETIEIAGNEWKLVKIAETFNYDPSVLELLDMNAADIMNNSDAVQLMLDIEQIKLLRQMISLQNKLLLVAME